MIDRLAALSETYEAGVASVRSPSGVPSKAAAESQQVPAHPSPCRKGTDVDSFPLAERFHCQGWRVLVYVWWDRPEQRFAGRAELYRQGVFRCRIALGKDFGNGDDAVSSLRSRARTFIMNWQRRVHNSDSEFSEL